MKDIDKIALAGFLHDIGKFAQRSGKVSIEDIDWQNFCPRDKNSNPTHKHAAYTAKVLGDYIVEKQNSDKRIISAKSLDFKFIEVSVKHHIPETKLEWIVAAADRLASGFERDVFEKYNAQVEEELKTSYKKQQLTHLFDKDKKFPLDKLSPENIFPTTEFGEGYEKLWEEFISDLKKINTSYPEHLKVQALDYLLKKYTSLMPSSTSFKYKDNFATKPNIPLYEHLKTTAVFTAAISKMEEENLEKVIDYYKNKKDTLNEKVFLLIAGDFFGIQNFIFDEFQTKYASKILRAKSAYIQLLIKLLAYYVVEKLGLSYCSIISTHAGKFEILAPNNKEIIEKLKKLKEEFNEYFAEEFFGQTGVGIVWEEASIGEFILKKENEYKNLRKRLADKVEEMKFKKFGLEKEGYKIFEIEKIDNQTLCDFCHKRKGKKQEEYVICDVCEKFVKIGQNLTKYKYIAISTKAKNEDDIKIFKNYYLHFFDNPSIKLSQNDIFIFDISKDQNFSGMEKWELSSYVKTNENKDVLTFEDLAHLSVVEGLKENKREYGVEAIMALKGDADGMGNFIKESDVTDSFAKYNFFARMVDYYFSVYVPEILMKDKPFYTVFAGGDDLFVIGAWDEIINLSQNVRDEFVRFTAKKLTFSVGMIMSKANKPVNFIAFNAEEALEEAKEFACILENNKCKEVDSEVEGENILKKDALSLFDEVMRWDMYEKVRSDLLYGLENFNEELPTTFLYRLLDIVEMSKRVRYQNSAKDTIWKSKLNYVYSRNISKEDLSLLKLLDSLIEDNPKEFKTSLFEFIYKRRKV